MEKQLTPTEQELAHRYYILNTKYIIARGRYMNVLRKLNGYHDVMDQTHKELLEFINKYGRYDNVCP